MKMPLKLFFLTTDPDHTSGDYAAEKTMVFSSQGETYTAVVDTEGWEYGTYYIWLKVNDSYGNHNTGYSENYYTINYRQSQPQIFIDLNQWKEEGPLQGNWVVSDDGLSVRQTLNTATPSFFISPDTYINTTFRGKFSPQNNGDDDFIGFVFGYIQPIADAQHDPNDLDLYVFNWKQTLQSGFAGVTAEEGYSLIHVKGQFDGSGEDYWRCLANPDVNDSRCTYLGTDYGEDKGYVDGTEYTFELVYFSNRIRISINGIEIFNITGTFPEGRFGFYNFSQANVIYQGFTGTAGVAVTTSDPAHQALSVPLDTSISVGFSGDVDAASVNDTSFLLTDPAGNTVTGEVSYDATTRTATFETVQNLDYNSTYTAEITTGVTDTAGVAIPVSFTWVFTTESAEPVPVPLKPIPELPIHEAVIPPGRDVTFDGGPFSPETGNYPHSTSDWRIRIMGKPYCLDCGDGELNQMESSYLTQYTIPASAVSEGMQYAWQVRYRNSGGGISPWSEENTFTIGVSVSSGPLSVGAGILPADFTMVSFTNWAVDSRAGMVFANELPNGYNTKNYRIGTYNAVGGFYREFNNMLTIVPGRSYWI